MRNRSRPRDGLWEVSLNSVASRAITCHYQTRISCAVAATLGIADFGLREGISNASTRSTNQDLHQAS